MKVIELFSGIGGMHLALKESRVEDARVVLALDINPIANQIYNHNFRQTKLLNRNIQYLTAEFLNNTGADTILMSPPCQPFTRNGLKGDVDDPRTTPFKHILNLLPDLNVDKILIENVKGFEDSTMRNYFIDALEKNHFSYQEFLLTPTQFGVPNSRLRYYCIARRLPGLSFKTGALMHHLPDLKETDCYQLGDIIEDQPDTYVCLNVLRRFWKLFDVCFRNDTRSCCFTRSYTRYAEGTGSVYTHLMRHEFEMKTKVLMEGCANDESLLSLKLRYFTPLEVTRLLSIPSYFSFPLTITDKQKYKVLGNSLNVKVVSELINLLNT